MKELRGDPSTGWLDDVKSLAWNWMLQAQDHVGWRERKEVYVLQWTDIAGK